LARIQNRIVEIIFKILEEERDDQNVNKVFLKKAISTIIQLGLNNAEIVKEEDDLVWKGDRNLQSYIKHFETPLLAHVTLKLNL